MSESARASRCAARRRRYVAARYSARHRQVACARRREKRVRQEYAATTVRSSVRYGRDSMQQHFTVYVRGDVGAGSEIAMRRQHGRARAAPHGAAYAAARSTRMMRYAIRARMHALLRTMVKYASRWRARDARCAA